VSSHYEILGIAHTASQRDVERRYRALAKEFHPDLHPDIDPARMEELNQAWEVLGDPFRRAVYDRQRAAPTTVRPGSQNHVDLSDFGFQDGRGGWMPFSAVGRNLWASDARSLEPLRLLDADDVWGLHLGGWRVVDDTDMTLLAGIPAVRSLRVLDISETAVTDAGLAEVAKLSHLEDLSLWGTAVTDQGVAALRPLEKLASLNLGETRVTDSCVESLAQMASLRMVNLRSTALTAAGLLRLAAQEHVSLVGAPLLHWRDRWRVGRAFRRRLA
jgi:hypothetical protein